VVRDLDASFGCRRVDSFGVGAGVGFRVGAGVGLGVGVVPDKSSSSGKLLSCVFFLRKLLD
jgi:hypothetical protein